MAPPSQATLEQRLYLEGLTKSYCCLRDRGRLDTFWPAACHGWFEKWPERNPDGETNTEATTKRRKYIVNWFRNHCKSKAPQTRTPRHPVGARKQLQDRLIQVYAKLYYAKKMRHIVDAELITSTPIKESSSERSNRWFGIYQRVLKEFWEDESQEVKQEVADELQKREQRRHGRDDGEDYEMRDICGPEYISKYPASVDDLPVIFGDLLEDLMHRTGWVFTVLMGGPDPAQGGKLRVASCHQGDAPPSFNQTFLHPYCSFLKSVFSADTLSIATTSQSTVREPLSSEQNQPQSTSDVDSDDAPHKRKHENDSEESSRCNLKMRKYESYHEEGNGSDYGVDDKFTLGFRPREGAKTVGYGEYQESTSQRHIEKRPEHPPKHHWLTTALNPTSPSPPCDDPPPLPSRYSRSASRTLPPPYELSRPPSRLSPPLESLPALRESSPLSAHGDRRSHRGTSTRGRVDDID